MELSKVTARSWLRATYERPHRGCGQIVAVPRELNPPATGRECTLGCAGQFFHQSSRLRRVGVPASQCAGESQHE